MSLAYCCLYSHHHLQYSQCVSVVTAAGDVHLFESPFLCSLLVFPGVSSCLCFCLFDLPLGLYNVLTWGRAVVFVVCFLFQCYTMSFFPQRRAVWDSVISCFYLDWYSFSLNHLSIYQRHMTQQDAGGGGNQPCDAAAWPLNSSMKPHKPRNLLSPEGRTRLPAAMTHTHTAQPLTSPNPLLLLSGGGGGVVIDGLCRQIQVRQAYRILVVHS